PALAMLVVGTMSAGLVVYSAAGLHEAVEQAARCYSVNATQCNSATATQTYAQNSYYGVRLQHSLRPPRRAGTKSVQPSSLYSTRAWQAGACRCRRQHAFYNIFR